MANHQQCLCQGKTVGHGSSFLVVLLSAEDVADTTASVNTNTLLTGFCFKITTLPLNCPNPLGPLPQEFNATCFSAAQSLLL